MRPAIDALQASGWPVYAFDLEGVPDPLAGSRRSAEYADDPTGGRLVTGLGRGEPPGRLDPSVGFDAEGLHQLTADSGGQLFENFNDLSQATAKTLDQLSVTYLLVFQPSDLEADGSAHRIEVRLRKAFGRARIVHPPSYRAPKPAAERTPLEIALDSARLVAGDRSINDLSASALVVPMPLSGERNRTSLVIEIPGSEIVRGRHSGSSKLELQAYGIGADQILSDLLRQEVDLDLAKLGERLSAGGLRFVGSLALPSGDHSIRVMVRDLGGDRTFLETRRLAVQPLGSESPTLLPPIFLDRQGEFVTFSQEREDPAHEHSGSDPFLVEGRLLSPSLEPTVEVAEALSVLVIAYPAGDTLPDLDARVLASDGTIMTRTEVVGLERLDDLADGAQRYVLTLEPRDLGPGRYRLELALPDTEHGTAAASTVFTVRSPP